MTPENYSQRLALHSWTVDTLTLADVLAVARGTGWNAVELRRVDFTRCFDAGLTNEQVLSLISASGMKVATLGTEYGLIFSDGPEKARLLQVLQETCANARALGCDSVMIAPGAGTGTVREAAMNFRAGGEVAADYGVKLALEFSAGHDVISRLEVAREILAAAGHRNCGLLLDAYHLQRSGRGGRGFEDLPGGDIFAVQYSDVPPMPLPQGRRPMDRLPPGQGVVRWNDLFRLLAEKLYSGYLSYEAPNPKLAEREPADVAREGVTLTRSLLATAAIES
jgi:2-keto-myo-inositol isomerase